MKRGVLIAAAMLILVTPAWAANLNLTPKRIMAPTHPTQNPRLASPGMRHAPSLQRASPSKMKVLVIKPKLSVVSFHVTPKAVTAGQPIFVHVVVRNDGSLRFSAREKEFVVECMALGPIDNQHFKEATLPDGSNLNGTLKGGCVEALPHQHVIWNGGHGFTPTWSFFLPAIPAHGQASATFRINEHWNWGSLGYFFAYQKLDGTELQDGEFWQIGDDNRVVVTP